MAQTFEHCTVIDPAWADLCTGTGTMSGGGKRTHKVHKQGGRTKTHKERWKVDGTTGAGVLWQYPVPSWGAPWSTCHGLRALVNIPWPSVVFALSKLQTI